MRKWWLMRGNLAKKGLLEVGPSACCHRSKSWTICLQQYDTIWSANEMNPEQPCFTPGWQGSTVDAKQVLERWTSSLLNGMEWAWSSKT